MQPHVSSPQPFCPLPPPTSLYLFTILLILFLTPLPSSPPSSSPFLSLGDRIGIMSSGTLVALGSSLHLKTKYGEGYRVSLVAPPDSAPIIRKEVTRALGREPVEEVPHGRRTHSLLAVLCILLTSQRLISIYRRRGHRSLLCRTQRQWPKRQASSRSSKIFNQVRSRGLGFSHSALVLSTLT